MLCRFFLALLLGFNAIFSNAEGAESLYKVKCLVCHASDGSGATPAGRAVGAKNFNSPDVIANASNWQAIIKYGKGKMPGYARFLDDVQINDLMRYVRGLPAHQDSTIQSPSPIQISHVYVEPSQMLVYDTVRVNAGQALQYTLDLTSGTRLSAQFQVSGGLNNQIQVMLLDEANYQLYLGHQRFSIFRGTSGIVRGLGNYNFTIPQTGLYHVLLDNGRAWLMARNVTLHLYSVSPEPTPESRKMEQGFENQYSLLKKLFLFKDFAISIRHCGVINAFSNPNITLCDELVDELARRNLGGAMVFVFFHELGHTLLREWGYPLWDNEDAADEFATVFLMMGKQQQFALQAAQYWSSGTTSADAVAKIWIDDRHTLSPQRARNIIHWLNNGSELLPRWQKLLIPNMQTEALRLLMSNPEGFNAEAVRTELAHRGMAN